MEKITNRFGAVVELKSLGFSVISARVVLPGSICLYDARRLSDSIMERLISDVCIGVYPLDDGSYLLCKLSSSPVSCELPLVSCVPQEQQSICFSTGLYLDDVNERNVVVDLTHHIDPRYDCLMNHCRVIDLRGTISVEVETDDHETVQD